MDRRYFLRTCISSSAGVWVTCQLNPLVAAEEKNERAMILLWMNGGPSQMDTFDLKPGTANGGSTRAIRTSASDIQISQHLPTLARQMHHVSLIRSMTTKEGSHERGRYLMHTGYLPLGATRHPSFGSIVSSELGQKASSLPNFVSVSLPSLGPGFLGMTHAAFHVPDPETGVPNAAPAAGVNDGRFNRRLSILGALEQSFAASRRGGPAADHFEVYQKGVRLMRSETLSAFETQREKEPVQEAYGKNPFGRACLLARRLVEAGVKCVEVSMQGWDTHTGNEKNTQELMASLDPAMGTLIQELADRGLLETTLVAWMGEFGRTPKINVLGGRDHWPKGWTAALAGAGVQGGLVVGKTSADGSEITDRPVTPPELFATFCHALKIDPAKENYTPTGRPIPIVNSGTPVKELFG